MRRSGCETRIVPAIRGRQSRYSANQVFYARARSLCPCWGLTTCCHQPSRPAHTDSNNSRKKHHWAGEENPTYADSKDLVGEENPSQCANGTRGRSSQTSQMPRKICCKQNTHRAEHLVAENDLGVRKVRVTDRETHRRHWCCNVPEVQQPICVPYRDQEEQNAGNSIQLRCFH